MRKPEFTIITVCYNSQNTIKRTIKSVLYQSYTNYEYIIIDGKSEDDTLEIINNFKPLFENKLILKSEKDNGIYDAMNKAIKIANGKWLCFLNSDDWFEKNSLENVWKIIMKNKNLHAIYGNINRYKTYNGELYVKSEKAGKDLNRLASGMFFSHQSLFTNKYVFDKIGGFDNIYHIAADWEFIVRMWKNKFNFYYLDKILANFSEGGMCSKSHVYERHLIRKKNKLYRIVDKNFIYQLLLIVVNYKNKVFKFVDIKKYEKKLLNGYKKLVKIERS